MWCVGQGLNALAYLLFALSPTWWVYSIGDIICSWSFNMASSSAIFLVEEAPAESRGWVQGLASALSFVGALNASLAMTLSGLFGFGWRPIMFYNFFFNIVVVILGALVLREPLVWVERKKLIEEGKLKEAKVPLRELLRPDLRTKILILLWFNFFAAWAYVADWYRTIYLTGTLKWDMAMIGVATLIVTPIGAIVGSLLFGRLSDKIGRLKTILISTICVTITVAFWSHTHILVGVGLVPAVLLFALIFQILWRIVFVGLGPPSAVWRAELFPTGIRATAGSFAMLTRAIFDVISTMAIAILMTVFSLGDLLTVASALGIVAVLPALAAKLETKGAKL
ncbi:MAG: MFS transporter [Candidatus Bathyarchaeia archaeon]